MDEERRATFEESGHHFESGYHLTLQYLPPEESRARAAKLFYENSPTAGVDWREPDAIRAEMMRDAHFNPVTAEHFADHEVQRCAEARVYALDLTRRILAAAVKAGDDA